MSIPMSCQYLCHVNTYVMSISMSCQYLCHVNTYVMSIPMSCQYLCHVNTYVMSIPMHPLHPPCVRAWKQVLFDIEMKSYFNTVMFHSTEERETRQGMYHKSYSSPEPQRRSSWQKLALFLLHKLVFIVARVDWCARIWLNVRISLLEKDSSTESKLLSAWGATTIQWNIKMSDYV